jgi:hypothetical protein
LPYFPANSAEASQFDARQPASLQAAHIGAIRGDLWAMAAITDAAPLLFAPFNTPPSAASRAKMNRAEAAAERAARLSPHDARIWLLLADLRSRKAGNAAEALKLSYYTAPNEFALAPVRLSIAGRVTADEELQAQVQAEVQRIVLSRSDLKPAIASAYKAATPHSRQLFEGALVTADPKFLDTLQ